MAATTMITATTTSIRTTTTVIETTTMTTTTTTVAAAAGTMTRKTTTTATLTATVRMTTTTVTAAAATMTRTTTTAATLTATVTMTTTTVTAGTRTTRTTIKMAAVITAITKTTTKEKIAKRIANKVIKIATVTMSPTVATVMPLTKAATRTMMIMTVQRTASNNSNDDNNKGRKSSNANENENNSKTNGATNSKNNKTLSVFEKLRRSNSTITFSGSTQQNNKSVISLGSRVQWRKKELDLITKLILASHGNEFYYIKWVADSTDCSFMDEEPRLPEKFLTQIDGSSLWRLCEENSLEFHLAENCRDEHCLVARQVFCLVKDLWQKCSEMDPRLRGEIYWTGSSSDGTKMWLPDEFDFFVELVELRGCCSIDDTLRQHLERITLSKGCEQIWSNLCTNYNDICKISPVKLKSYMSILLWKAAFLLERQKYPNIQFNLRDYDRRNLCFIQNTKVSVNLSLTWSGTIFKNLEISVDVTPGIPIVISEKHVSELRNHADRMVSDRCIHVIPYISATKEGWRPSFSLIEVRIIKGLTRKQRSLYKCLKFLRDVYKSYHKIKQQIPSYHLKTFLLGALFQDADGQSLQFLEREDFCSSVRRILSILQEILEYPFKFGVQIEHFFVKSKLTLDTYDMRWCKVVLDHLQGF